MNDLAPFEKHVLIALSGMTPAVVSETVYALIGKNDAPDVIVLVTTGRGLEAFRELEQHPGWEKLRRSAGKKIRIEKRVFQNDDGEVLDDIVSEDDNRNFADTLLGILREYTENPDTKISFSIAGGRKTMSAIGALCMTMLGRKQDRLYHVLVDPPFDQPMTPAFFFPEPGVKHKTRDGQVYDSGSAGLHLSELPFVYTRYRWQETFQQLPPDFTSAVARINAPPQIKVDLQNIILKIGGEEHVTGDSYGQRPKHKILLLWLLYHWQKFGDGGGISGPQLVRLCEVFRKLPPPDVRDILKMQGYPGVPENSEISRCFSDLNKCLNRIYGNSVKGTASSFSSSHGKYSIPDTLFRECLTVSPELSGRDFGPILCEYRKKISGKTDEEK